jgi:hypothetical protein
VHVVVANLLQSRHTKVTMVTEEGEEKDLEERGEREIEQLIVDEIISKHSDYTSFPASYAACDHYC